MDARVKPAHDTENVAGVHSAVHGDDDAADRPEQRIFDAGEIPDPFAAAVAPARPGGDQQEYRGQRRDISGVDGERQPDRADHLDGHAGIDPRLRRMEPPSLVDLDEDAADRPEQRIFDAGEIPDPFAAAVAPARPGGDQQEYRGQRRDISGVDGERQPDRADHLDGHAGIDPRLRRMEPPSLVDLD